jgi:hypothetical protein
VLIWVIVKNCVETSGLAVIVIVDALSVRNTVEGSRVCVMFITDVSADNVTTSELRNVVVMKSDVMKVEPGSVVVSIRVSLMVKVWVSGGLEVVKVNTTFDVAVTVW